MQTEKPDSKRAEAADGRWLDFVAFLKSRGCRITGSREAVFRHILDRTDHFLADVVAHDLRRAGAKASRATVYNTLKLMAEAGFVRQIRDSDVHAHYEPVLGGVSHDHMICEKCGRFIEFPTPTLKEIVDAACTSHRFRARISRLVILGTCRDCAEKP